MLYDAYEVQRSFLAGASKLAGMGAGWLSNPANPFAYNSMGPLVAASLEVFAHAASPRGKPEFGLTETRIGRQRVAVHEEIASSKPFGQLKHFVREGAPEDAPKLLIVAPMSGHYATLLRGTVERLLPNHDIYITDWADAKLVPLHAGTFDLDDYIDYLIEWVDSIGEEAGERPHILAVCQPAVPAFAATALMNAGKNRWRPKSLSMMGGPIDTRKAPTAVNTLATERPIGWFQNNVIATVPMIYPGAGRKVYPGFLQLAGFMVMNLGSHLISHWEMFKHLVEFRDPQSRARLAGFCFVQRFRCRAVVACAAVGIAGAPTSRPERSCWSRCCLADDSADRREVYIALRPSRSLLRWRHNKGAGSRPRSR